MEMKVDKQWKTKGLSAYSSEAIWGTLRHYGVTTKPETFPALAEKEYPLTLAEKWFHDWKGAGQFTDFPLEAARVLSERLFPDRLLPSTLTRALVKVIDAVDQRSHIAEALEEAMALAKRMPAPRGVPDKAFISEVVMYLGKKGLDDFNQAVETLLDQGFTNEAFTLATLEEMLFVSRRGLTTAIVRAARGEKVEAVSEMKAIFSDMAQDLPRRMSAVDVLLYLREFEAAHEGCVRLFSEAEKSQDFSFGHSLMQRLEAILEALGEEKFGQDLIDRMDAFAEAAIEARERASSHASTEDTDDMPP